MFRRKGQPGLLWFAPVLALLLICALTGVAGAHASLIRSDPPNGALRDPALAHVTGWFDLPLQPESSTFLVFSAAGAQVSNGDGRLDLSDARLQTLVADLRAPLAPGAYLVRWHVMSDEGLHLGHITEGQFIFWVGEPGGLLQPGWLFAGLGLLGGLASLCILGWSLQAQGHAG